MMLTLAYTMHRGKVCRQQQDCILIDGAIHQVPVLPITALSLVGDEAVLAVADGVASSGGDSRIAPQQASRIVLEELLKAVREHPEWLQDGFVANRHVRRAQVDWPSAWAVTARPTVRLPPLPWRTFGASGRPFSTWGIRGCIMPTGKVAGGDCRRTTRSCRG